MRRLGFDGTRLTRRLLNRFHSCGGCAMGGESLHAVYRDAVGLKYAFCLSCRAWNRFVG